MAVNRRHLMTPREVVNGGGTAVTVALAGNTEILELPVEGLERLFVQFDVATNALDAFTVNGKAHPDASYVALASAAGDYTTPVGIVIDASGDLTTVAAAGTGWVLLDCRGLHSIQITASCAVGAGTVTPYYCGTT